jgi:hypothetical protein
VVVNGNVTCSELIGNGEFLDGVANVYELSALDSKITCDANQISSSQTRVASLDVVQRVIYSRLRVMAVLDKLSIGTTNQVLFANTRRPNNPSGRIWETLPEIVGDIPDRIAIDGTNEPMIYEHEYNFNISRYWVIYYTVTNIPVN